MNEEKRVNEIQDLRDNLNQLLEEKLRLDEEILRISRQLDKLILLHYADDSYNGEAN